MRKAFIPLILILLSCISGCRGKNTRSAEADSDVVNDTIYPLGFLTDTLSVTQGKIKSGQTFSGLMGSLGMDAADVYNLTMACDTIFDARKIIAGNSYEAYYTTDSLDRKLRYVVYSEDRIRSAVFRCFDSLAVWHYDKPVYKYVKNADIIIESSLWNAMIDAGASPLLTLKLSDIFAWTVDFFGLQKGDRFRATYVESVCDSTIMSIDSVYFSVFSRDGKDLYSIMYDQGDGGNLYWNEKGESMRKAFLKAPLQFTRISSRFSYARRHPITGQVRPHTAVDYAAPMGTPVMSIGDGTGISRKYEGGGGNTVRIRHNSVYTTAYLHLSKFAAGLHEGQRVRQGEVIGYVGSTGSSTGPHLDFRVWQNGSPVNPLTLDSPSEEPIKEENKAALDSVFRHYLRQYGIQSEPDPGQ